jgi:4-phytase/acid phosphatase
MRSLCVFAGLILACTSALTAQATPAPGTAPDSDLQYVVYLSRHGVRSPTGKAAQYSQYSTGAWPEWPVQPGYLTPHGFHLMELFGSYDRLLLAGEGLLSAQGCADAARITVYADSDQRTRETGKALAQGLMPGCGLAVQALPEGTNDPLFHALGDKSVPRDPKRATAAVAGRIGGDPANLTLAYRPQLQALNHVLASCGTPQTGTEAAARTSILDIPTLLAAGTGDHLVEMKGPLNTASTLAENLLLEYTEGMDKAKVGWGCVGHAELQSLLTLHTAATDFAQRTPEIATAQAAGLLKHIGASIEQAASRKPVTGAIGKPTDLALFLIGHDTNQENVGGMLNLTWIVDGRRDDTPPGGALVFELWWTRSTGGYIVRTFFTAQTLDQMREAVPLTSTHAPDRVPVFVPGCSNQNMACELHSFVDLLEHGSSSSSTLAGQVLP